MAGRGRSPARAAVSRLPGWVTALGIALVLAELTGGGALLAKGPGGPRTAVLRIDNAYSGDGAAYTTPTGGGYFDIPTAMPPGGWQGYGYAEGGSVLKKTVMVQAGGIVTINTFSGYNGPFGCSITVNGKVVSQVRTYRSWDRATCRARIP